MMHISDYMANNVSNYIMIPSFAHRSIYTRHQS